MGVCGVLAAASMQVTKTGLMTVIMEVLLPVVMILPMMVDGSNVIVLIKCVSCKNGTSLSFKNQLRWKGIYFISHLSVYCFVLAAPLLQT